MRLSFGVLGKILRECKNPSVSDVLLVGTLTRTIDSTCQYADSDGSSISRLLSCGQNLSNGHQRRVGRSGSDIGYETNRLSNVVSAAQEATLETVSEKIEENFLPLLDEDAKQYIVPTLLYVIEKDDSLDVEKRMNFIKFFGCEKAALLKKRILVLPDIVASALLFTCVAVKNTTGKETAKMITHDFVIANKPGEAPAIKYHSDKQKDVVVERKASQPVQLQIVDESPVSKYLCKTREKYQTIKTLLYKSEPVPFYDFYVCNDILEKMPVQNIASNRTEYKHRTISNATADLISACSRFVILTGSGGVGKSMMLRHLLLNAIDQYVPGGYIPVFIPVRDYSESTSDLFDYIYSKIEQFGTGITREFFISVLDSGRVLLLLDGLDEIGVRNEAAFEKDLEAFVDRYPENRYIMSSRPHRSFVSYSRFTVLKLCSFTKAQAVKLIENLDFRTDMPEIKEKFIHELDDHLYRTHNGFASNPLLLTIMLMTFERYAEVPSKMHIFYKEAFDTLAKEHDAAKAYSRPLKTGLPVDRFEMYFAEFCSRSYHDEKFEFTEREFIEYYNSLSERSRDGYTTTAEDFLYDARANLCLMFYEGGKYFFSHRSFQEYFCAFYFSKQKDKTLNRIGDFFEQRRSRNYGDQTFNMLYDMIPGKIEEYIFRPFLSKLLNECQEKNGYWSFLETMYPTISYETGETNEVISNTPSSYLYEFMKSLFFPEECDCSELPQYDSLIAARYFHIEQDGVTSIVEASDVSYEYISEWGYPDESGRVYEADIHDILRTPKVYDELLTMLNDDSFALKREYAAAFTYLKGLEEQQTPQGDGLFDLFT